MAMRGIDEVLFMKEDSNVAYIKKSRPRARSVKRIVHVLKRDISRTTRLAQWKSIGLV